MSPSPAGSPSGRSSRRSRRPFERREWSCRRANAAPACGWREQAGGAAPARPADLLASADRLDGGVRRRAAPRRPGAARHLARARAGSGRRAGRGAVAFAEAIAPGCGRASSPSARCGCAPIAAGCRWSCAAARASDRRSGVVAETPWGRSAGSSARRRRGSSARGALVPVSRRATRRHQARPAAVAPAPRAILFCTKRCAHRSRPARAGGRPEAAVGVVSRRRG